MDDKEIRVNDNWTTASEQNSTDLSGSEGIDGNDTEKDGMDWT